MALCLDVVGIPCSLLHQNLGTYVYHCFELTFGDCPIKFWHGCVIFTIQKCQGWVLPFWAWKDIFFLFLMMSFIFVDTTYFSLFRSLYHSFILLYPFTFITLPYNGIEHYICGIVRMGIVHLSVGFEHKLPVRMW